MYTIKLRLSFKINYPCFATFQLLLLLSITQNTLSGLFLSIVSMIRLNQSSSCRGHTSPAHLTAYTASAKMEYNLLLSLQIESNFALLENRMKSKQLWMYLRTCRYADIILSLWCASSFVGLVKTHVYV